MRFLAGIVLYNPDINRLKDNIGAIYSQVETVVFVNNGSENFDTVKSLLTVYPNTVTIDNGANLGIATALKQIMEYGMHNGYDWVLTLDQDSVCQPNLIQTYAGFCELDKAGILTCNIVDRNFSVANGFKPGEKYREVRQCITSASLISTQAYRKTDGFDEKLFIDSVDFDICINMRIHGFKIYKINFDGILHEVGHGKNVKLLLKDYVSYNHSPFRQYYMARNHKYLVKKYPDQFSRTKEWIREIREEVIILFYEERKMEKLKSRWKGLREADALLTQE